MDRESRFIILTERDRFLFNSKAGGGSFPSIKSLRPFAYDPNTFLSSQIPTCNWEHMIPNKLNAQYIAMGIKLILQVRTLQHRHMQVCSKRYFLISTEIVVTRLIKNCQILLKLLTEKILSIHFCCISQYTNQSRDHVFPTIIPIFHDILKCSRENFPKLPNKFSSIAFAVL